MKYLCLVYADEAELHSLPESPEDSECFAYTQRSDAAASFLASEANNLDAAIEYAKGIPAARVGSIEVRPVRHLDV